MIEIRGVTKVIKKEKEKPYCSIKKISYDENYLITKIEPVPEKSWDELQERLKKERKNK